MKKALIIIPDYPAPYTLPTGPGDRSAWLGALGARNFSNIQISQGYLARSAIIAAIQSFAASLQAGDNGALILSGHGSRLSGSEPDGWDECFVSSDIQGIRDHEMGALLQPAISRGAVLDVAAEFCYSGTSTDLTSCRTWCACGPGQTAWWGHSYGVPVGIFTVYATWFLQRYPATSASALMSWIRYYVAQKVPQQTPQLDGGPTGAIPF